MNHMKQMLYKELKFSFSPLYLLNVLFVFMLLIPSYPYYVAFAYLPVVVFFMFLFGRENNDMTFTCCLPVRKKDIVTARFLVCIGLELLQVLCAIPVALLSVRINPNGSNLGGIEPNMAFFGLVLVMLGTYNMNYFPKVYKNLQKPGRPLVDVLISMFCFILTVEAAFAYVPSKLKDVMDTMDAANYPIHASVLAGGAVWYVVMTVLSYKKSVRNFEAADL